MLSSSLLSLLLTSSLQTIQTTSYSIGDVNPRALQGIWRLTSTDGLPFKTRNLFSTTTDPTTIWQSLGFQPMKEFTTYPKKKEVALPRPRMKQTELYIKLKDDMTFEQCSSLLYERQESMEDMLAADIARRELEMFAMKGTWDYVDGRLILASDRPEKESFSVYDDGEGMGTQTAADTILVGKVSVSLEDGYHAVEEASVDETRQESETTSNSRQKQSIDVHLSVPKGKIKTGKFMYPKHHPSFFEQPIFNPQSMGHFELQQIEGDHKAEEDDLVELFRKEDLAGKRFYLSTFPLRERKKKDRRGRIIEEDETKVNESIQVVAIEFFANNTFATVNGLGSSEVRRGKWSIIGEKRDQVWIQVYRFGFGRSVSYSTYSEGTSLTQDDERAYWGKITEVESSGIKKEDEDSNKQASKKIEIDGAIMIGTGLEPCSIGRFRMIEMDEETDNQDNDKYADANYVQLSSVDLEKNAKRFELLFGGSDGGESTNHFDLPGAFE